MFSQKQYVSDQAFPLPGSDEEKKLFHQLQQSFTVQFENIFSDRLAKKTIVIIPSLTLDQEILLKLRGHIYYEERLLCLLMLLQMPQTNIIYISSLPIDPVIVDYYIHLLPDHSADDARKRLHLLSCYDTSVRSLTEKILDRPRLIHRIKELIHDTSATHMTCFNVTGFERSLAVRLGIPVYGCDPDLLHFGTKSGCRSLFKQCGIHIPPGYEHLKTEDDLYQALTLLKRGNPQLKKAVIKLEDGFSGDGNAVYTYPEIFDDEDDIEKHIRVSFHAMLKVIARDSNALQFIKKFEKMGGIVEEFMEGLHKTSPSVQCRIDPLGESEIISTHDQLLGGEDEQVFLGAHFPANEEYCYEIALITKRVADALCEQGALGRFSLDFISVKEENEWKHYALEINLRKGGTTHPFLLLQLLTDGVYHADTGAFITAGGDRKFYFASDNVESNALKGLTPLDLMEIVQHRQLLYDSIKQEGIMFHLMGALSEFGKLGILCIGNTRERAGEFFEKMVKVLNEECAV